MIFNEEKAREAVNYLLKNDIKIYRKFIPLINDLDSKSFENLFNGRIDFKYKIKMHHHFKLLIAKFDNFKCLLEEWYEEEYNYIYLKELWLKNISLESLINKKDIEIEKSLEKKDIYISQWPRHIKEMFLENVRQTTNTVYYKIKNFFKSIPEQLKKLFELINSLSYQLEKKGIKDIAYNLLNYGISIALFLSNCPQIEAYKNMCKDFITKIPSNISFKNGMKYLKNNLSKYKDILKDIYDKKSTKVLYVITSLYNLGSSIYDIYSINKLMTKINDSNFGTRLQKIEKKFNEHRDKIHKDLDKCDITQYDSILKDGIEKIETDENDLKQIMIEIDNYIREVDDKKNAQFSNIIGGVAQVGIGIIGGILTGGATSALYFTSSGLNAISVIFRGINIDKLKDLNRDLKDYKNQADILHNEIYKELTDLKTMLKQDQEAAPVYL